MRLASILYTVLEVWQEISVFDIYIVDVMNAL